MNLNEFLSYLEKAKCEGSVEKLKDFIDELKSETCEVCTQGEDQGCEGCKVGEMLGETPY